MNGCPACGGLVLDGHLKASACADPACVAAHGFTVDGLIPITWALAGQWWPDACVLWDRDIAPEGWEPRLLVECKRAHDTIRRPWTGEADPVGPLHWVLHAHEVACVATLALHIAPTDCRCVLWAGDRWTSAEIEFAFTNSVGAYGANLTVENMLAAQRGLAYDRSWVDEPREWRREYLGQWVPHIPQDARRMLGRPRRR